MPTAIKAIAGTRAPEKIFPRMSKRLVPVGQAAVVEMTKRRRVVAPRKIVPVQGMVVEQRAVKRKRSAAQLSVELKFLDNSLANQALVAATTWAGAELDPATTLCLTAPAQGDTASSRDGKQIIGKSVHVTGQVYMLPAELENTPPIATHVFLALVLDKQTNNAQLNSEDVFTNVAADASLNTKSIRNLNFAKRFKVLKTQEFVFDNTAVSHFAVDSFSRSGRSQTFDWFIPLNDLKINFNSTTTGVIGNVLDNSIHVIGIANSTLLAPTVSYNSRFRFIG